MCVCVKRIAEFILFCGVHGLFPCVDVIVIDKTSSFIAIVLDTEKIFLMK